jgi:hypothetical protein
MKRSCKAFEIWTDFGLGRDEGYQYLGWFVVVERLNRIKIVSIQKESHIETKRGQSQRHWTAICPCFKFPVTI